MTTTVDTPDIGPVVLVSEQDRRGEPLPPVVELLRGVPAGPLPPFPLPKRKPRPKPNGKKPKRPKRAE